MSFNLGVSLMVGHCWDRVQVPSTIDKDNKVVREALFPYVWRACGGICFSDLSVDRAEVKPDGIYAYPNTENVAEGAALPTYVYAAFPPSLYRALVCQSEGRCPRCEKHALTGNLAVCSACAWEMGDELPKDGTLYVRPQ